MFGRLHLIPKKISFRVVFLCAALLFLACLIIFAFWHQRLPVPQPVDSAYDYAQKQLSELSDLDYQRFFVANIDIFFRNEGINGMIHRVTSAVSEGQITMFVCHSLAHDIGHYGGYPDNFGNIDEYLSKENLDFCGSGFLHGVEGQLANEPYPTNVELLYKFCKMTRPYNPFYEGCYHGAGHAFMENTRNVMEALGQCDRLRTEGEEITPVHCYRGVFSEHANYARSQGEGDEYLLTFCSSLLSDMRALCAKELNGLELPATATQEEVDHALRLCVDEKIAPEVQLGCVRSVAGIAVDHILGNNREVVPPPVVATFNDELLRGYIHATHGSFVKSLMHTHTISLNAFCSSFSQEEYRTYCFSLPEDKP